MYNNLTDNILMDDLLKTLQDQAGMIRELIRSAEDQQEALVHLRADDLEKITHRQTELLLLMQQKERLRWHIVHSDLGVNKQDAPRATLSELLTTMQEYEQEMYGSVRNELAALLARLQQLNNTNRLLAQRARNSTSHILDFMRDNVSVCNVQV